MSMASVFSSYPLQNQATKYQYRVSVQHWEAYFGARPLHQVKAEDLAGFTASLLEGRSVATVNKIRRHCRALLRWAVEIGELDEIPTWRTLREVRRAPEAFLVEEFSRLIETTRDLTGRVGQIQAAGWWTSLLLATWYSGARIGAIMSLKWGDVGDHCFKLRGEHQKQKADQLFRVGEDCWEVMEAIRLPSRPLVWPWPYRRESLYIRFRIIARMAQVPLGHGGGCLFHRIRKSTASYIRAAGGDATSQLGHSCSSVTARYYDPRICGAHDATGVLPSISNHR